MLKSIILITILLFVVVLIKIDLGILSKRISRRRYSEVRKTYQSKQLLTPNELEFFNRIKEALPEYLIFVQVSFGAMLNVKVSGLYPNHPKHRNAFAQKMADFVVCNKNVQIVALIELDDKTHDKENDAKRDAMLIEAGYVVIRWNSKNKPSVAEIRKVVLEKGTSRF